MSEVKRYGYHFQSLDETEDGRFVEYTAYEQLKAENDKLGITIDKVLVANKAWSDNTIAMNEQADKYFTEINALKSKLENIRQIITTARDPEELSSQELKALLEIWRDA